MKNGSEMKKVLVLGSAGMLGYAVYEYFMRAGYDVTGIERSGFDAFKSP
jgi:nucleoside-diphosphate-sugar epimerase